MQESTTYQAILEEGRRKGELEGQLEGEKRTVLLMGSGKFGPPSADVRAHFEGLDSLERLDALAERLWRAASWDELIA